MNDNGTIQEHQEVPATNVSIAPYVQLGFGFLLVVFMIGIIIYYFSSSRKKAVEAPKYDMLRDDDEDVK